jgi:hypothetical protein
LTITLPWLSAEVVTLSVVPAGAVALVPASLEDALAASAVAGDGAEALAESGCA